MKAFGTMYPDDDATPKCGRSSSLMFYKKAISYFMPHKLMSWNIEANKGNPTKSIVVNDVIKKVLKFEVRKQGTPSQARRPLTIDELKYTIQQLKYKEEETKKYAVPALCCFQFHMIARIDDSCHFMVDEIKAHETFDFALRGRLRWSKNVMEERHAPTQLVLGSNDADFCVLINLGIYLEHMYPTERDENGKLNCFALSGNPDSSKARAARILKEIFQSDGFQQRFGSLDTDEIIDLLGSHSLRKLAATFARKNGCSRDEVDLRGRWKHQKGQVDTYIDTTIPYPDAKVAAALCPGGPVMYDLVQNCGLDDCWLYENVVPNIMKNHKCKKTSALLGRAVLWACHDPLTKDHVPQAISERVTAEYERIRTLEAGINPVKKVGLVVAGHEGQLFIDQLPDPEAELGSNGEAAITDMN